MTEKPTLTERLTKGRAAEIREARIARGWSQARLAEEAGTSQQTVDRIERGQTLHSRAHDDVMDALQLPRMRRQEEMQAIVDEMLEASSRIELSSTETIPLYSMGLDTRLATLTKIAGRPERFIERPEKLRHSPKAYAVSVFAVDEMAPVIREGDILFVDPDAPIRIPCEAIFRAADGDGVLVRTVTFRMDDGWVVEKWDPNEDTAIDREVWPELHPIVGKWSR